LHCKWAICDVRFQNEIDWIYSVGGYIINIGRPNNPIKQGLSGAVKSHASEPTELVFKTERTWSILNRGTLNDLNITLQDVYDGIKLAQTINLFKTKELKS